MSNKKHTVKITEPEVKRLIKIQHRIKYLWKFTADVITKHADIVITQILDDKYDTPDDTDDLKIHRIVEDAKLEIKDILLAEDMFVSSIPKDYELAGPGVKAYPSTHECEVNTLIGDNDLKKHLLIDCGIEDRVEAAATKHIDEICYKAIADIKKVLQKK